MSAKHILIVELETTLLFKNRFSVGILYVTFIQKWCKKLLAKYCIIEVNSAKNGKNYAFKTDYLNGRNYYHNRAKMVDSQ